ncbi:hypothetical protein MYX06_02520 [Patescibacteria group bacterium AH-259-L05]|nr:hypothetical protein [Patescibacteria group bacterium AH-259-L05]
MFDTEILFEKYCLFLLPKNTGRNVTAVRFFPHLIKTNMGLLEKFNSLFNKRLIYQDKTKRTIYQQGKISFSSPSGYYLVVIRKWRQKELRPN